jgi:hypothetical protein
MAPPRAEPSNQLAGPRLGSGKFRSVLRFVEAFTAS